MWEGLRLALRCSGFVVVLGVLAGALGCAVVKPNQVGVKQTFGRLQKDVKEPGLVMINPLTSRLVRVQVQTKNLHIQEDLPSREGLTVRSETSVLYSIKASDVPTLIRNTGLHYERDLILPVFRSAAADICSQYDAKDMHSARRGDIELAIRDRMAKTLETKGVIVEQVLMKTVKLPDRISESIERKLEAEQDALRMAFVAEQQRREMDRQIIKEEGQKEMARIKAEGDRDAQIIAAEARGQALKVEAQAKAEAMAIEAQAISAYNRALSATLTRPVLEAKRIEAMEALSTSSNTKLIFTDGKSQVINLMGADGVIGR